jgi:hypothetical protein
MALYGSDRTDETNRGHAFGSVYDFEELGKQAFADQIPEPGGQLLLPIQADSADNEAREAGHISPPTGERPSYDRHSDSSHRE